MFDIGFSELLVIAVVALIVIGPERLPGVARTLGHLFGRMQRYVNDVKADIQREMELDELRKLRKDVEDSAREIQESARSFEESVTKEVQTAETQLRELETYDPFADTTARPPAAPGTAEANPPATGQLASEASPSSAEPSIPPAAEPPSPRAAEPGTGSAAEQSTAPLVQTAESGPSTAPVGTSPAPAAAGNAKST